MRAGVVELPDSEGLYAAITVADVPKALLRKRIGRLGRGLARAVRDAGRPGERVLCVVVLRGGALLYPAFADEFGDAAFCMLGLRRVGGDVVTEYRTEIPGGAYDRVVYLDCVAATGRTIFAARRAIAPICHAAEEVVAVVCAATTATRALRAAELGVIGFSLHEAETSGVVAPDFGRLDAGEVFADGGDGAAAGPAMDAAGRRPHG
ncbi:uracil phosphoribosyltransferase [Amycolatopsis sp.]|uniref:uracil phosphoribosyltransferase n=1 Tax=Amycolatopsis sp. TaxID=37632 RepID=UPI002D7E5ACF|nr:uracil phosphoribosyltransferase [Amycolatopsis sp.]HET6711253.1 uracil phosphoribosyltransferase [Amycolatopsis sp.]